MSSLKQIECAHVEKQHVYCALLRWNKNKGFSYFPKLTHGDFCYLPASSFMKTVGFSTMMSQCPSSIGGKSISEYVCSSAYLQKSISIQHCQQICKKKNKLQHLIKCILSDKAGPAQIFLFKYQMQACSHYSILLFTNETERARKQT